MLELEFCNHCRKVYIVEETHSVVCGECMETAAAASEAGPDASLLKRGAAVMAAAGAESAVV